jgi:hypothetical protein
MELAAKAERRGFGHGFRGSRTVMTIGGSIFLIALGAILRYATNFHLRGLDVDEVGLILMIAGAVLFVLALAYELVWAGERARWYRRDRYEHPDPRDPRYTDPRY